MTINTTTPLAHPLQLCPALLTLGSKQLQTLFTLSPLHTLPAGTVVSAREIVSRVFKGFADQDGRKLGREQMEITDHVALKQLAEF